MNVLKRSHGSIISLLPLSRVRSADQISLNKRQQHVQSQFVANANNKQCAPWLPLLMLLTHRSASSRSPSDPSAPKFYLCFVFQSLTIMYNKCCVYHSLFSLLTRINSFALALTLSTPLPPSSPSTHLHSHSHSAPPSRPHRHHIWQGNILEKQCGVRAGQGVEWKNSISS
jgi:hypothetical protein